MDLLFALQNLRETAPSWLNRFFIIFSEANILIAPLVAATHYWCADKRKGRYVLTVFAFAFLANSLLKITFCVYRPWILDPRLYCVQEAAEDSSAYSFPSSHCMMMSAIFGAVACAFRERKWILPFAISITVLMMFARMYLGCHTLGQVLAGAGIGVLFTFLLRPTLSKSTGEVGYRKTHVLILVLVVIASALYARFKPYPLDMAADGTLLVDPLTGVQDVFAAGGAMIAIGVGTLLETKYVHFETPVSVKKRILRCIIGSAGFIFLYSFLLKKLVASWDPHIGKFFRYLISVLWFSIGYPAVIKALKGKI